MAVDHETSMKAFRTLGIVLVTVGLIGCQSAPRFAWWKKDSAPEDSSVMARSAPELPSKQATPQTMTASRESIVKPPAYTASAAALPPSAKAIPPSSAVTIFGAPTATYAGSASAPPSAAGPPPTAAPPGITTQPTAAPTVMAQASPYDPNAYPGSQRSESTSAAATQIGAQPDPYGGAVPDRYGMTPSTGSIGAPVADAAAQPADRYGLGSLSAGSSISAPGEVAAANPAVNADDRYATTPAVPVGPAAVSPTAPVSAVVPPTTNSLAASQQAIAPTPPSSAAPATMATVQLASPPGQYRPGGTSSYQAYGPATQTEIASRVPAAPGASPPPAAATTLPGAPTQPAYQPTPAMGTPGVRAY